MRFILLFLVVNCGTVLLGQKANYETVKSFWENTIQPIIDHKEETILLNTEFPLKGSWGYHLDLKEEEADWNQAVFKSNLNAVFSADFRSKLKEMNFNYLVHHTDTEGKFHFILQINFTQIKNGVATELFYYLYFTKFDESWKLYQIEIAG
jgi:hypothetical protein